MTDSDAVSLSKDELFTAVAADYRRAVIDTVSDDDTFCLETITKQVASQVAERRPEQIDPAMYETVKIALVHHHLPHLDDVDIVAFDATACSVQPGENIDQVDPLV